jgi:hypothetical protein
VQGSYTNFSSIHVAYRKIGLNTPMAPSSVISHYRHCELMVRNVYSFFIITSNNCWRPHAYMLKIKLVQVSMMIRSIELKFEYEHVNGINT